MADHSGSGDASRLADFVNHHIQGSRSLDNLDLILKNLEAQQDLQRKQLHEAEEILKNATRASDEHAEAVRKEAQEFKKRQAEIDRRLIVITKSDNSDEAVRKFESSIAKLQNLDVAQGYLQLLSNIDTLSKDVLSHIKPAPFDALRSYKQLRSTTTSISAGQEAAEGATPHLLDYANALSQKLGDSIQKEYTANLQSVLEKMKWPVDGEFDDRLLDEWTNWCDILLEFQESDIISGGIEATVMHGRETPILLPLKTMVRPLELRFKYHFNGDKPTNRLDKPEYFFSHVLDLINTHAHFFTAYLQPILNRRASENPIFAVLYSDAVSSYISALLPMVRQKVLGVLPQLSQHPQLLSHLMHELMKFDNELRNTWSYLSSNPAEERSWKGLTWEILTQDDWFLVWLEVEKNFALSRYQNIIDAEDGGEIDYESVPATATKPTKSAIRVNDLLENITELYQPLQSFSQKLRFLIDIQINIFDLFHERLHSGLEAYLARTSAIGRTVQSSTAKGASSSLEGVAGLDRLCRIFGSAEYLEKKMQDWSDDVFFLELWYDLQDRVKRSNRTGKPMAGPMSISEIATHTSASIANNHSTDRENEDFDGALFDETATAYRRIRMRSENVIQSAVISSVHTALKAYYNVSTWASLRSSAEPATAPSLDLVETLRVLSAEFSFLSRTLAVAPRKRVASKVLLDIQAWIWDNVLMRNNFSTLGATQLSVDVGNICSTVDTAIGTQPGELSASQIMQKLMDGLLLLNLKIKPEVLQGTDTDEGSGSDSAQILGLWDVEKRLFANNESARKVLIELGIQNLTEAESRATLERRVEVRS
ncbi:hypothetical protein FQN57_006735 [Myotisia sp. PD_48]|nr:hypothetical protein FQN57_006735 [Myotisia sp. PD_48]